MKTQLSKLIKYLDNIWEEYSEVGSLIPFQLSHTGMRNRYIYPIGFYHLPIWRDSSNYHSQNKKTVNQRSNSRSDPSCTQVPLEVITGFRISEIQENRLVIANSLVAGIVFYSGGGRIDGWMNWWIDE